MEFDVKAVALDGSHLTSSECFGQAGEETIILPMIKVIKDMTSSNIGQASLCQAMASMLFKKRIDQLRYLMERCRPVICSWSKKLATTVFDTA